MKQTEATDRYRSNKREITSNFSDLSSTLNVTPTVNWWDTDQRLLQPHTHISCYLPVEHGPHDRVEGALGDEVVHVDRGRLPDAVGSVLRLLDVTGVPVELGEHHVAGCGESQALESGDTKTHNLI